jgi:predicted deacylase
MESAMTKSKVWTTMDFNKSGFQYDYVQVPNSTNISAYGGISIPIICARRGLGKTVLLTAGNHGDEYEGQIALIELVQWLSETELAGLNGRIIVLPSLNFPAVAAGERLSPIDGGNLNRLFPGTAHGSPTEMLAHFIVQVLFPISDVVIDLHSGGRSLSYYPLAYAQLGPDESYRNKVQELLCSFNAPLGVLTDGGSGGGATTLYAAAAALGIPAITTELGGGANLSSAGLKIAAEGVNRVLKHYGVVAADGPCKSSITRLMKSPGHAGAVYARNSGLFRLLVKEGDRVLKGQVAGLVYSYEHPLMKAEEIIVPITGVVACVRFPTHTLRGDCLLNVLVDA